MSNLSDSDSSEQEETLGTCRVTETKIENMLSLGDTGFQVMPDHFFLSK
jgi:hypothetical protein